MLAVRRAAEADLSRVPRHQVADVAERYEGGGRQWRRITLCKISVQADPALGHLAPGQESRVKNV